MTQPTSQSSPTAAPRDAEFLRWRIDELENNERRLRALVEQGANVIVLLAANGTILYQSPSVGTLLGYGQHELVGRSFFERVDPLHRETGLRHWAALVQNAGRSVPIGVRYRHKDGTWRWLDGSGTNLTQEPAVQAIVLNLHDATESHRAADDLASLSLTLQQQVETLQRLNRTVRELSEASGEPELVAMLARAAQSLLHADGAMLCLAERDAFPLKLASTHPPLDPQTAAAFPVSALVMRAARSVAPVALTDTGELGDDPLLALWPSLRGQNALAAPLVHRGSLCGVLAIVDAAPRIYADQERGALAALASAAAAGLERLRTLALEREKRMVAETMGEIGASLAQSLDLNEVLERIPALVSQLIAADAVMLMRAADESLRVERWSGPPDGAHLALAGAELPLASGGAARQLLEAGHELLVPDAHTAPDLQMPGALADFRSFLAVPIHSGDALSYCLCVAHRSADHFRHEQIERARAVARQLALALNNAALVEDLRAGAARAQALAHRLVEVQELERSRIAREIHDAAGQSLTSILVGLRMFGANSELPETMRAPVEEMRRQVGEVLDDLHHLAGNLRPPALDHAGLAASLHQMVNAFHQQYGTLVRFETVGLDAERFAPDAETALYRIVQEALTNVARHAQARSVDVILERRTGALVAIVEDDGTGFDVEAATANGRLGLIGMQERAVMLGGRLTIESAPGWGTTVQASVPCETSHAQAASSFSQLPLTTGGPLWQPES